ncbi:MAG: SLC13 family permease [Myxococcota bacterium]
MKAKRIGLFAGPIAFALLAFVPSGLHHLPGQGHRPAYAAAVTVWMAVWWFTEALPIWATACLPLLLFPALGVFGQGPVGDAQQSISPYVDPYIFLFMGGMCIGAAMEHWSLHRRVALNIMRVIGTDPRRLLWGVLVATAAVSMWISNTATAVMMVPIGMALLAQLQREGGKPLSGFGAAIMLAVAYAANVGGIATKIGTGTNSIFSGFVSEKLHVDLSFLQYLWIGLPFVALFLPVVWWTLWRLGRHDAPQSEQGREVLARELSQLGPMSSQERVVAVVFALAALLWVVGSPLHALLAPHLTGLWEGFKFQGKHYEASVAMLAAAALAGARVLPLTALRRVPWGTLVLLGGSFAMAEGISGSGLSAWLTVKLAPMAELPLLGQLLVASTATVALSAVASNTATVNLMLNILPGSLTVLATTALAASCDFALPAGTPPNAIVFGSGYVRLPVMMRVGVTLDLLAAVMLALYGFFYVRFVLG